LINSNSKIPKKTLTKLALCRKLLKDLRLFFKNLHKTCKVRETPNSSFYQHKKKMSFQMFLLFSFHDCFHMRAFEQRIIRENMHFFLFLMLKVKRILAFMKVWFSFNHLRFSGWKKFLKCTLQKYLTIINFFLKVQFLTILKTWSLTKVYIMRQKKTHPKSSKIFNNPNS